MAPAHAATEIICTANRLSAVGHHDAAFLPERVKFPSYAEGTHEALTATERELDRKLGSVTRT